MNNVTPFEQHDRKSNKCPLHFVVMLSSRSYVLAPLYLAYAKEKLYTRMLKAEKKC